MSDNEIEFQRLKKKEYNEKYRAKVRAKKLEEKFKQPQNSSFEWDFKTVTNNLNIQ